MNTVDEAQLWNHILAGKALAEKTQDDLILSAITQLMNAYTRAVKSSNKNATLSQPEVYAWNCITTCRNAYLTLYGADVINRV